MKECIGFGVFENKCPNEAGTRWSPHWCERCNKLRLDHIGKRFKELEKVFGEVTNEHRSQQ